MNPVTRSGGQKHPRLLEGKVHCGVATTQGSGSKFQGDVGCIPLTKHLLRPTRTKKALT